jgi:hypothetical protein
MKFAVRLVVAALLLGFGFCSIGMAVDPLALHWDLTEWTDREGKDHNGEVSVSAKGLSIEVKKDNFCIPLWQKLPSKARYLSYFTVSAELVELKGGHCGIGFATEKNDLLFLVSPSKVELRYAGGDKVIYLKEKRIETPSLPANISFSYDTRSGELSGLINGKEVIRGNVEDEPQIPKFSFIRYVTLWDCTKWRQNFARATFLSLDVEAR